VTGRKNVHRRAEGDSGKLRAQMFLSERIREGSASILLTFSPISTSRRMAWERPGLSACLEAQSSTAARISPESRIAVTGSCPVAGRPGRLRTTFFFDDFIKTYYAYFA
jgi:hypothetical protein